MWRLKAPKNFKLKTQVPTEKQEQIKLASWLDKNGILYTASANGELRDSRVGRILKLMGVKKGYPDISLPYMRKSYGGLYIELKRQAGGTLSKYQRWWLDNLTAQGYLALRANGCAEAQKMILDYLGTWTPIVPLSDGFDDDIEQVLQGIGGRGGS